MPFKIYTYEDPYKLNQTDFWDEISTLPHFCSARTLVNGLKDVLGDNIQGLICPLDDLINHEDVYKHWTDNINLRIQQYSALSTAFNYLLKKNRISPEFHTSLTHNQNHFLDALRLFIELNIPASAIDGKTGNIEQKLYVYMLHHAQSNPLFSFPQTPNKVKLKDVIVSLAKKEVADCNGPEREVRRCERAVLSTGNLPLDSIVVHGVHQFSPVQLRFLLDLSKMGINIIFLFNYQKKYSQIYSSWYEIYSCFDVPIHHDANIPEYQMPTMQNPSNALASALGLLYENRHAVGSEILHQRYQLYKSIDFIEFANITEYAHFVSHHVDSAIAEYDSSRSVRDRGNHVWNNGGVLARMEEQVYTANRDIHTLLKIYYPEYSADRHFLSYPIGQFFSAIYKLWDYEKGCISFNAPSIKECLSSNILSAAPGDVLLRTFYNTEVLFDHISTYKEFQEQVVNLYPRNYEKVNSALGTDNVSQLRQLSIYNKYKVPQKDMLALISAIEEINEIATSLFSTDKAHEDYINFGQHFQTLEEFLKQRELALATEQERSLIIALQLRLAQVKPEESKFSGTFRDLREGLYFYLKQKSEEDQNVNWFVKNFEQIDGDILQSSGQFNREQKKVYHFACLSDRDMNMSVNDQLPWPLTDDFIQKAYAPVDLQFQVYYTALSERSNFLRYALFYGLCYNRCDVRLSYVKQYDNESTEPYAPLSILGLIPKPTIVENLEAKNPFTMQINSPQLTGLKYSRPQMIDMFLCPYRYFLDYIMEDSPVFNGHFLYQKFFENTLVDAVWKRIGGKSINEVQKYLDRIIREEGGKLSSFFPFWKPTEIFDLELRAQNYLLHDILPQNNGQIVNPHNPAHMRLRKLFGKAKFIVDISDIEPHNPYSGFESLAQKNGQEKIYSLYRIPSSDSAQKSKVLSGQIKADTQRYLNQSSYKDRCAIPSDWCTYCTHKGMCVQPFFLEPED